MVSKLPPSRRQCARYRLRGSSSASRFTRIRQAARAAFIALASTAAVVAVPAPSVSAAVSTGKCSVNSGAAGPVTFVNNSSEPVHVKWVGFDCHEKTYATLQPGTSYVQQSTYTGHLWLLRSTTSTFVTDARPALPNGVMTAKGNGVCSEGSTAVPWSLRNNTGSALDMYYLDHQCKEVFYGQVAAGATRQQQSYVGHRWRLKTAGSEKVAGETTVLRGETAVFSTAPSNVLARTTTDRADATTANQVKVLYAVPSGALDRRWDLSGRIGLSVSSANRWLSEQSGGRKVRMDTSGGALDITYVALPRTAAQYASSGVFARNEIEKDLMIKGFNKANKKYIVFYQGPGTSCGTSYWPPKSPGNASVVFLEKCPVEGLTGDSGRFGFTEATWIHELFHGLGVAAECSRYHTREGHVSDDPSDLMYAGTSVWRPALLDAGGDDYWTASTGACPGIKGSPYIV